jgi:ferredoxin
MKGADAMHIDVNLIACEGHGLCAQTAANVYEVDDEGYVRLRVSEITPELEAAAAAGARVCPVAALKVVA